MLIQLEIENIALIDKLTIAFAKGLNVLTGETGAGKSIIINSLKLVFGGRTVGDEVGSLKDKGIIQAVFALDSQHICWAMLEDYGLAESREDDLILTRELNKAGKNTCRINGRVIPLSLLREVGLSLVDLQGQYAQQSLLKEEQHLALLDAFGGKSLIQQKNQYQLVFVEHNNYRLRYSELLEKSRDKLRKMDMLQFQIKEIDEAGLTANEDKALQAERKVLANSEKLSALLEKVCDSLVSGGNRQLSALDQIRQAASQLGEACKIDESLEDCLKVINEALYQLDDTGRELKSYFANLEFNPYRLDEIENRLALISNLRRKYGENIEEVLTYRQNIIKELDELEDQEFLLEELQTTLGQLDKKLKHEAGKLTKKRKELSEMAEKALVGELTDLGMSKVSFKVQIDEDTHYTEEGIDKVHFLISPNPGQPLKSLAKIASGGETSRIFLALKTLLTKHDNIETLIFDEVDAGLGGDGVQVVAHKLELLGNSKQVICITHAPQIAAVANNHLYIYKEICEETTKTFVKNLNLDDRVQELSRMMSGSRITETTLKHAKEILKI